MARCDNRTSRNLTQATRWNLGVSARVNREVGGTDKGRRGVQSTLDPLGTSVFWNVRGIRKRLPSQRMEKGTRMKRFLICTMFATALLGVQARPAIAEVIQMKSDWSGSLSRTASDIIDDTGDGLGATAIVSDLTQKGTFGIATVRVVSETTTAPTGVFTANCSAQHFVEFPYLAHSSVTRLASTGDLIYTLLDDGYVCLDPSSGQFIFSVDVFVVGGTGRFAQATGSGNATGGGQFLLFTETGSPAFGSLEGNTFIQLHLPDVPGED
jgi:hypothetical protein